MLLKGASLFVEVPESAMDPQPSRHAEPVVPTEPMPTPRTVQDVVNSTPGPKLEEITAPTDIVGQVSAPGGSPDFPDIYRRKGLVDVPFTAEQALDVINSMPSELPLDVRRRTVQATLQAMGKAMGVNTDAVIGDATRKLAALASYEESLKTNTARYVANAEAEIATLQQQIEAHKQDIDNTKGMLDRALQATTAESERLDDVLEFFTQDVGASKYADPSAKPTTP